MKMAAWAVCAVPVLAVLGGCSSGPVASGSLGYGQDRRVVIVGEGVAQDIALYYQRHYDAKVWFTPPQGLMEGSKEALLKGLRPSTAMRSLINELESINDTARPWEIIVPKIAEGYVLDTFKNMPAGSLSHARGDVVLIDSKGNKPMEAQVARVTGGSFFVTYEFQKY